jgi:hypothetical protein
MRSPKLILMMLFFLLFTALPAVHADVIVKETRTGTTGWGVPDTPIGDFFYLIGDVVEFPFNLLGNLF